MQLFREKTLVHLAALGVNVNLTDKLAYAVEFQRMHDELAALVEAVPAHWEGKLLGAWLQATPAAAAACEAEDPGDPRVLAVCAHATPAAAKDYTAELDALLKQEPGMQARLDQFLAATRGEYLPPARFQ